MKAINIQRRRLMTSLALSALAAAPGASWAQTAAKALAPARGARIVVVSRRGRRHGRQVPQALQQES